MLARIRKSAEEKDQGFTLIELLVVMIIIGILAAIAIPTFLSQRKKAREASAKADVKALATEIESSLTDGNPTAAVSVTATGPADLSFVVNGETYTSRTSNGNTVKGTISTAGVYCASATTTDSITWRVANGQLTKGAAC